MSSSRLTRRATVAGLIAVAPAIIGCRGKSTVARTQPSPGRDPAPDAAPILQRIRSVSTLEGKGATVQRVFPTAQLRNLDPFVLLDDFDVAAPAGFPDHPHLGFEAFTYMLQGAFHHRDNLGNDSMVAAGGTQRFNSGKGARHSEMPGPRAANRGLQLWVNLPRRLKKMTPEYQAEVDLPVREAKGLSLRQIVGKGSAVDMKTAVDYADVTFAADGRFERDVEEGWNTLLYVLAGAVTVGEQRVERGTGVLLGPGALRVHGDRGSRAVYLGGKPHGEPIYHRGPFVY